MKTADINQTEEETSGLSSPAKATSTPSVAKTKYRFPYYAGVFGIAAKRYKPAQSGNMIEITNDPGINLAY